MQRLQFLLKNITLFTSLLLSIACNPSNDEMLREMGGENAEFASAIDAPTTNQPAPKVSFQQENITKKIIKTGGIDFQSENIEEDYKKIRALLPKYNAYIENENQSKSTQQISYHLTVRVPSNIYDSLYSTFSTIAFKLDNKYSNIEDVTERYYDLETRIKNKKSLEERYLELLKKATAIKDILEVEMKLNDIRTEIEMLQGQFNYLSKQINYSTIHLSFYEVLPYVYDASQRKGFGARILSAINSGWQGFLSFMVGLITLWPFLILTVILVYLLQQLRKRLKRKSA